MYYLHGANLNFLINLKALSKHIFFSQMIAVLILALLPLLSFAQDSNLGNWLIYIGNKKVSQKWNLHHEVQYRNYNAIGDLEQLLLRTGIGHSISDNANLLLGYGFIHSQNYIDGTDDKVNVDEHRIFQQFITKANVGKVSLQHRYRFEQRFVSDDLKLRFRYFLGINVPFSGDENNKSYLSLYNEIFLNSLSNVFDRNRVYLGIGHKLNQTLKLELGYMNQFLNGRSRDQINLIVFSSF